MAIEIIKIRDMVFGADHAIHPVIKAAMLRHARIVRETQDGTMSEYHQRWARQVLAGNDGSYTAILRELSMRQPIQDLFTAGATYTEANAATVRTHVAAVLDAVIAAQLG